jgi:hypothetical protein
VNHGVKLNSKAIAGINLYEQLPLCKETCFGASLLSIGAACVIAICCRSIQKSVKNKFFYALDACVVKI